MFFTENLLTLLFGVIVKILSLTWWFVLPIVLFYFFWKSWLVFIKWKYVQKFTWATLEIKIPKEVLKTPKAMEQIFSQIYGGIYSYGFKPIEKYWDGKVEKWLSFEIVGRAGSINFFIYTPSGSKNLVKSSIYSQYPDAEVSEVEDYMEEFPEILPNQTYDLWGAEFKLAKDAPYPIRVYSYFEENQEEKRIDPLSAVFEAMSQLQAGETIVLQFLVAPTGKSTDDGWIKEGQEIIEKIADKAKAKKGTPNAAAEFLRNFVVAPAELPVWGGVKSESKDSFPKFLRPDEQEVIKAVSNKMSKTAFRSVIRFVFIDRKDSFSPANIAAVTGAFNQFSTENLNTFKLTRKTSVSNSFLMRIFPDWKKKKIFIKKREIYKDCRERNISDDFNMEKLSLLNVEELATVYHYPITATAFEAPTLKRVGAKTGGPPSELPIE
ncbi:MAG: hypothetical protein WC297_00525 [Candidatus Paceibacterota bacterium]|jgi:hypothetical protein